MVNGKLVIAIDFDGTIVEEGYPNIGAMRKGAYKYIRKLVNEGHFIIINTCRSGEYELEAKIWCMRNNIFYHYFNKNHSELIKDFGCDSRKISADIYIDDKNLVKLPSWKEKYSLIKKHYERIMAKSYVSNRVTREYLYDIEMEYEEEDGSVSEGKQYDCLFCEKEMTDSKAHLSDICVDCMVEKAFHRRYKYGKEI